jgi:hypothetical protein
MRAYDEQFISDFMEWVAQNCTIEKGGDPWTGDIWQSWFYYKGEQMIGWQLLNIYNDIYDLHHFHKITND